MHIYGTYGSVKCRYWDWLTGTQRGTFTGAHRLVRTASAGSMSAIGPMVLSKSVLFEKEILDGFGDNM